MNRKLAFATAAATALALLATATLAAAADGGVPDCPPAEEHEFKQFVGYTADETYYLNTEDEDETKLGLWRELNTWPGLQTEDGECNSFGEIESYSADVYVDSVSDASLV